MLGLFGRPDTWSWLLTFHLIGAFTLVGAAITVSIFSVAAIRSTDAERIIDLRRLALRTNLLLALPAFVVVHIFGQMLADKEFPEGVKSPDWLGAGFGITDGVGVIGIIILSLLQWWVLRRARSGARAGWQAQVTTWLSPTVLAALLVVLFLMAGKPGS